MGIDGPTVVELVKFVGVPTVILCLMIYGIYKAVRNLSIKIIEPVAKRHLEFVDEIAVLARQNAETDKRFADSLEVLADHGKDNQRTNERIADILQNSLNQRERELNLFQGMLTQVMSAKLEAKADAGR